MGSQAKTAHTPGPWAIEPIFGESDLSIVLDYPKPEAGNPVMIGFACEADEHGVCPATPEEAQANARLMATAPDLLSALIDLLRETSDGQDICAVEFVHAARAAIDKATNTKNEPNTTRK